MQGKVQGDTFIVMDAYALPVEGTETRVNAQAEAYEYIVAFGEESKVRLSSPLTALARRPPYLSGPVPRGRMLLCISQADGSEFSAVC